MNTARPTLYTMQRWWRVVSRASLRSAQSNSRTESWAGILTIWRPSSDSRSYGFTGGSLYNHYSHARNEILCPFSLPPSLRYSRDYYRAQIYSKQLNCKLGFMEPKWRLNTRFHAHTSCLSETHTSMTWKVFREKSFNQRRFMLYVRIARVEIRLWR